MGVIFESSDCIREDQENHPEYPFVITNDEVEHFLAIRDGMEYELRRHPGDILRLLHHLTEKKWADNTFFDLAISRICIAFGWWYPGGEELGDKFCLTQSDLLERGWTKAMITEFLGDPHEGKKSFRYGTTVLLYHYDRILAVEESDGWQRSFVERLSIRVACSDKSVRELMHNWSLAVTRHRRRASTFKKRIRQKMRGDLRKISDTP